MPNLRLTVQLSIDGKALPAMERRTDNQSAGQAFHQYKDIIDESFANPVAVPYALVLSTDDALRMSWGGVALPTTPLLRAGGVVAYVDATTTLPIHLRSEGDEPTVIHGAIVGTRVA